MFARYVEGETGRTLELDVSRHTIVWSKVSSGNGVASLSLCITGVSDDLFNQLSDVRSAEQRLAVRYPNERLTLRLTAVQRADDGSVIIEGIPIATIRVG